MNYLAHLFLGYGRNARFLAGNLAGDFVRGAIPASTDSEVAAGIRLHRKVDAFTDSHPVVGEMRRVFVPRLRHHARIALDVVLDHFLAIDFSRYSDTPLQQFSEAACEQLLSVRHLVPPRCASVIERMSEGGWLESYGDVEAVERALYYLSRRLSRNVDLTVAVPVLETSRHELDERFEKFFPELVAMARAFAAT